MIEATITHEGDVMYRCNKCGIHTIVKIHDTESVFWDMHNGLAVLAMLGHYKATHEK